MLPIHLQLQRAASSKSIFVDVNMSDHLLYNQIKLLYISAYSFQQSTNLPENGYFLNFWLKNRLPVQSQSFNISFPSKRFHKKLGLCSAYIKLLFYSLLPRLFHKIHCGTMSIDKQVPDTQYVN